MNYKPHIFFEENTLTAPFQDDGIVIRYSTAGDTTCSNDSIFLLNFDEVSLYRR